MSIRTFEDRLISSQRRPSGFDYLRIGLSISVVVSHTINISYGLDFAETLFQGPFRSINAIILPMFFALSGFLVAGSLERCQTLVSFLGLRVIRLVPALVVETILCALLIGSTFTNLSLKEYFSSPIFREYFLNIIGDIHYDLPGVFASNPAPSIVNGQLWTLPFELKCYATIALFALLRFTRRPVVFVAITIILNTLLLGHEVAKPPTAWVPFTVDGWSLIQCFLYGIALHLFRIKVVASAWLASLCGIATLILLLPDFHAWGDYVAPLPATYLTVYLGLLRPKRLRIISSGDYSYGIFLYGTPIQQAAVAAMGPSGQHWYINLTTALPLTILVAAFSWWCVEKPALKLRPMLFILEGRLVSAVKHIPGGAALLSAPPSTR